MNESAKPEAPEAPGESASRPARPIVIRPTGASDVDAMVAIYSHHIARGVDADAMYDIEAIEPEDLKRRRKNFRDKRLPHLAAEADGIVIGYAYAVQFRKRPAYRYTVKHSIYVHHAHQRAGVGRLLLPALIDACAAAGYRQMIGYIDAANAASLRLHETCGFRQVGFLPGVGLKFGRWSDVVMVQRSLGPGANAPPDAWPSPGDVNPDG